MKATVGELQRTKSGEEAPQLESLREKKQKKERKDTRTGLWFTFVFYLTTKMMACQVSDSSVCCSPRQLYVKKKNYVFFQSYYTYNHKIITKKGSF